MKSILSLVLVLAIAPVASAAIGYFSGGTDAVDVLAGDTVVVDFMHEPAETGFMTFEEVVDTASTAGTVQNASINAGFTWADFTGIGAVNPGGNILLQDVTGIVNFGDPKVSGALFSFEYEVSGLLPLNEVFTIGPGAGLSEAAGITGPGDIGVLTLTVVPEPATIALFGLGSLVLLRRRR
jgi:catabolite regulation protein CreA